MYATPPLPLTDQDEKPYQLGLFIRIIRDGHGEKTLSFYEVTNTGLDPDHYPRELIRLHAKIRPSYIAFIGARPLWSVIRHIPNIDDMSNRCQLWLNPSTQEMMVDRFAAIEDWYRIFLTL